MGVRSKFQSPKLILAQSVLDEPNESTHEHPTENNVKYQYRNAGQEENNVNCNNYMLKLDLLDKKMAGGCQE